MSSAPLVSFEEFAREVIRPVELRPGVPYQSIGVRWYGEGLHVYETREGHEFVAGRFEIKHGDLIYNDMWARKGSVAIVPEELSGCVASSHFPTFELDTDRVVPQYLSWFFRTPTFWEACERASRGSTGRNQIKRRTFLAIPTPLPTLPEQQRIVDRIEALAGPIAEARSLRRRATEEAEALCRSIITGDDKSKPTKMSELAQLRQPDVVVQPEQTYQFAGVYSFGRGVFRSSEKTGLEFAYPRLTRLRARDFVYPKLMAWEGAFGVVPKECDGCVVSTEFPVFEINEARVLPEVLDTYFRMPTVWPAIAGASTGTNVRRRRLNPRDFLAYMLPLPSRDTQERLRRVCLQVEALKRLQAETAAKLDALMPAILDRAFKGEL